MKNTSTFNELNRYCWRFSNYVGISFIRLNRCFSSHSCSSIVTYYLFPFISLGRYASRDFAGVRFVVSLPHRFRVCFCFTSTLSGCTLLLVYSSCFIFYFSIFSWRVFIVYLGICRNLVNRSFVGTIFYCVYVLYCFGPKRHCTGRSRAALIRYSFWFRCEYCKGKVH